MELVISYMHLKRPPWTLRNKFIADNFLEPSKSVLDLGSGAKDLLKYYDPTEYLGVDGMDISDVDLVLDLDANYQDHIKSGWDYSVNSGILEYVKDIDAYLQKQKSLANEYVFTYWQDKLHGKMDHNRFESILAKYYDTTKTDMWGIHKVYKCIAK